MNTLLLKDKQESENYSDTHTVHCCAIHKCRYGYDQFEAGVLDWKAYGFKEKPHCTVSSGEYPQLQPCEKCIEYTGQERFVMIDGVLTREKSYETQLKESLDTILGWAILMEMYAKFSGETKTKFDEDTRTAHKLLDKG